MPFFSNVRLHTLPSWTTIYYGAEKLTVMTTKYSTKHTRRHRESTRNKVQGTHAQRTTQTLAGKGHGPRQTGLQTRKQVQGTRIRVENTRTQKGICGASARTRIPDVPQPLFMTGRFLNMTCRHFCGNFCMSRGGGEREVKWRLILLWLVKEIMQ